MKHNRQGTLLKVEELESRALPSGFASLFSPAVQADFTKIRADAQQLQSDAAALAPTLQRDQQAIQAAIAASPTVQAAQATATSDLRALATTLQADWQLFLAATNPTLRSAVLSMIQQGVRAGVQRLQADQVMVQAAINNDAAVQAAQTQLRTDTARLTADQAVLQADLVQFWKDLQS